MSHLNIANLETMVAAAALHPEAGRRFVYAETGRYKPWMPATIKAAERRGYLVEQACDGVFHVYPKDVEIGQLARALIEHQCRRAVDARTRNATADAASAFEQIGWALDRLRMGDLRRQLGDALCMNAAPCVKVDHILALLTA